MSAFSRRPMNLSLLLPPERTEPRLTADAVAAAAGIRRGWLDRLIQLGLVEPTTPGGEEFSAHEFQRIRRMLRLHDDLGVHFFEAGIIVDLLERIEQMEAERGPGRRGNDQGT